LDDRVFFHGSHCLKVKTVLAIECACFRFRENTKSLTNRIRPGLSCANVALGGWAQL
jgi:hypothetical protein